MADRQQILEKVKKLLALAERGGTPEESANAAAKAQAILARHDLDRAALEEPSTPEPIGYGEPLETLGRMPAWRVELGSAVARANGCRILISRSWEAAGQRWVSRLDIIGRPADVEAARTFHAYLRDEVTRLLRLHPTPPDFYEGPAVWSQAFRRGVVHTLDERLKAARRKEAEAARARYAGQTEALVRLSEHQRQGERVDSWIRAHLHTRTRRRSEVGSLDAWLAGTLAGEEVDLEGGRSARKKLAG